MASEEEQSKVHEMETSSHDIIVDHPDCRLDEIRSTDASHWIMFGEHFPSSEIRFFAQVFILYVIIITCLANLTVGKSDLNSLWISLLCSSTGLLLPSPQFTRRNKTRKPAVNTD